MTIHQPSVQEPCWSTSTTRVDTEIGREEYIKCNNFIGVFFQEFVKGWNVESTSVMTSPCMKSVVGPTVTRKILYCYFLHDRPWISPWIKSISNELDITIHVITSQLFGYCDVINNRLWRHQQNVNPASETRGRCVKIVFIVILSSLCRVRNIIMHVLSWRTVSALPRVLFWCLFPPLLRNSGNKHQNNPLLSAETVRHSNTYIILYLQTKRFLFCCERFEIIVDIHKKRIGLCRYNLSKMILHICNHCIWIKRPNHRF